MKKIFLLGALLFTFSQIFGQTVSSPFLLSVIAKLDTLSANHPIEKVYLQLDKPYYNPGDTLRFKAYLTVTDQHQLSAVSGIVYTDLIGPDSKIVKSIKMQVVGGTATGDISIPDTLAGANYHIRAYTNWMRNTVADYFFDKTIKVVTERSAQVIMHAIYKSVTSNNLTQQHAILTYTDKYGKPYAGKMVSYLVKQSMPVPMAGQAKTDTAGKVDIILPANNAPGNINGSIETKIKLYNNATVTKSAPISASSNNAVQFFPEGGQQVAGIRSKIAFKAIGADGLSVNAKGTIIDNEGNDVAYFLVSHLGMGSFAMTPQSGKTYSAKVVYADGSQSNVPLPAAAPSGFVLAVDNSDSLKLRVRILANPELFTAKQNTPFYLVGQSGERVFYTTLQTLNSPVFVAEILKSKFPTGIVQFTLFSDTGEPLNERVVFIQNNDQLKLDIQTGKKEFASREPVNMNIIAKDSANKPVAGSFSMAVMSLGRVPYNLDAQGSILSYILLTSELQGYIEEPGYYFNKPTAKTNADLDVLMLSQGYRRFEWKKIMAARYPTISYLPEQDINISGTLKTESGKPVVKGKMRIFEPKSFTIIDTLTNDQGKFNFDGLDFPDTTKLVIQARKANDGKHVNISLDLNPLPKVYPNKNLNAASESIMQASQDLSSSDSSSIVVNDKQIQTSKTLSEVLIRDKKSVKPTIFNGYGTLEQYEVKMSRMAGYGSIFDALGRIPGIFHNGRLWGNYRGAPISIYVDELEQHDQLILTTIKPEDVQGISVIAGSKIMITTKASAGTDIVKLSEVKVVAKKTKTPKVVNSVNLNGQGVADQVIIGDKMLNCGSIKDCLISRMFGTSYSNGEFYALRRQTRSTGTMAMQVLLDGVQVPTEQLDGINSGDVSSVEILSSVGNLSIYGSDYPGGLIIVTTRRGAGPDNAFMYESVPGVIYYKFNGFYKAKTFYAPRYDHQSGIGEGMDLRSTIYWNPNINTDKTGKSLVKYFNADSKGTYQAIIEGIDADGNVGHAVYEYKVQ